MLRVIATPSAFWDPTVHGRGFDGKRYGAKFDDGIARVDDDKFLRFTPGAQEQATTPQPQRVVDLLIALGYEDVTDRFAHPELADRAQLLGLERIPDGPQWVDASELSEAEWATLTSPPVAKAK